ncbi:hypothetical protein NDU88_004493 [Pleurodeles waltl]|uniref:Uncharacterized protein n=1 Tax=Pleurodeles waltl TaxID=8319 RepID=A0AAV7RLH2_PLEWA|nr:hypothetical protein NDU88_004493 [Pleurodeles waltl]
MSRAVTQQSCVTGGTKVTVRRGLDEVSQNISHVTELHGPLPPPEEEEGAEDNCDPLNIASPEGPSERVGPGEDNEPSRRPLAPAEATSAPEVIHHPVSTGRSE